MIKKFRPMWSLDIVKTEKWLSSMASEGYHLIKINVFLGTFIFRTDAPKEANYRLVYDKTLAGSLPKVLADDGWNEVFHHGKWSAIVNYKPLEHMKTYPSREGMFNRNSMLMLILGGYSLCILLSASAIALLTFWMASRGVSLTIVPSPLWSVTTLFWALNIFMIFFWIRLMISNRRLHEQYAILNVRETGTPVYSGKLIVKWKFGWQYSPDRLEQWLEKMELQGYKLYRVGSGGVKFLFTRGRSRRVKYFIDYQNTTGQGYLDIHREAGWKLLYTTSLAGMFRWTIWAQEYNEGEAPPQFYSDRHDRLKHARRVAVSNFCFLVPLIVLVLLILNSFVDRMAGSTVDSFVWSSFIPVAISVLAVGILTAKTWLYYWRLKNQIALIYRETAEL